MKELWFSEYHSPNVRFDFRIKRELYSGESEYQHIHIFDSYEFGRVLVLDGCVMVTERDEFIYHEMLVHVPMSVHPDVKRVLVIGAGDGGTLKQLCRYPDIEAIDLVEIDGDVIDVCREFLPHLASSFDDPRVAIHITDGLRFVRHCQDAYDLILVDSTDPFGPGEGLFTREFFGNCYHALEADGILVNQHESPYYRSDAREVRKAHANTREIFEIQRLYQAHIPTYPSGHWLFGFMSKHYHPLDDFEAQRFLNRELVCDYYNPELHRGAFALPSYVQRLLNEDDDDESEV
ncbi:MAG: polyamine aminopropyltransferase [Eubacteriales bacterium]|nr:polyamine aminopropyltransferase [Eubacteriales bacterium]